MEREIPQHLHTDAVFLGMAKEEFLALVLSYGFFGYMFDLAILGAIIGILIANILMRWKEEKPRGVVYYKLRRWFPFESGSFNTGIDPIDRRVVA